MAADNIYLRGQKLVGDDYTTEEIREWFQDERNAYYDLKSRYRNKEYTYHALNMEHGFSKLPATRFQNVLGIGSAAGEEFEPIVDRCERITILEPAEGFANSRFEYVKPHPSGKIPFPDDAFDLILCFGVLHHIPNVSFILKEIGRVSRGYVLVSEPIVSMGDWQHPRPGLTARERGIPLPLFRQMIVNAELTVLRERKCMFSLSSRWRYILRKPAYNSTWVVKLDSLLASLPVWYQGYHPRHWFQKLRAMNVFFILAASCIAQEGDITGRPMAM